MNAYRLRYQVKCVNTVAADRRVQVSDRRKNDLIKVKSDRLILLMPAGARGAVIALPD
jgi:hypothetical protein